MSDGIDPDNLIPLYAQLEKILYKKITSGQYRPGDIIPSESELISTYKISRITVRKAIEGLVAEGLLSKHRGRGTIVNTPKFIDDAFGLQSFSEKTNGSSISFSTEVLDARLTLAPALIAMHMGVREGDPVLNIKRLRFCEGEPIGYFENYILGSLGLSLEEDYRKSLYQLMEQRCGVQIKEAKREVSSILADRRIADLLEIERPASVMSLKTYSYDIESRVVEFSEGFYRSDRYQFVVHLNRNAGGAS